MEEIQENVNVFLQKGKVLKAFKLQKGKKIVFEKLHFLPDKAFGHPYNTYFRVASNELEKVEIETSNSTEDKDNGEVSVEDNRMLDDSHGKSQSLCREEIVNMKSSGAAGEDIVNEIVKNSATFTSKTTYSQKKYLKKKRNKHLTSVRILKPSARLLCRMYESREPAKICQIRLNTFSQILTMANIRHGSKVAVVENCSGVLLSIIMERLSGSGNNLLRPSRSEFQAQIGYVTPPTLYLPNLSHSCMGIALCENAATSGLTLKLPVFQYYSLSVNNCGSLLSPQFAMKQLGIMYSIAGCIVNLHTGETPTNFHAASLMNFPDSWWKTLHSLPLCKIGPLLAKKDFNEIVGDISIFEKENPAVDATTDSGIFDKMDLLKKKSKKEQLTEEEKGQIRLERKRKRLYHQKSAWDALEAKSMDAVILACRYHPSPIFLCLLELLSPARPFVVHCENQEPLMELYSQLLASGKAINLKISETFTRQYQVLPEQTHPMVTMNTTGGYLFTGIKVDVKNVRSGSESKAKRVDIAPSKRTKLS